MKNILLNYDSKDSLPVLLDSAINLRKSFNSSFIFAFISEKAKQESKSFQTYLTEQMQQKGVSSLDVQFIYREGKAFETLPELAKEINADTIVTKVDIKKGFQFFKDNTVYNTVVTSPCPVITLTEGTKIEGFKNILLPIDITAVTRQKIPFAIHIAKACNSVIHAVGFGTDKDDKETFLKLRNFSEQSRHYLNEKGIRGEAHLEFGDNTLKLIKEFIKKNNCDIVMITVDEETSIFSSEAEKLVYSCPVPVICIQPKDLKVSWAGL